MLFLLKPGELMLKKGNRRRFEQTLRHNIQLRLPRVTIQKSSGRVYVSVCKSDPQQSEEYFAERLATLPGITGFAPVHCCPKNDEAIAATALQLARQQVERFGAHSSFRLHVRRSDKSLSRDSQGYAVWLGSLIGRRFHHLKVRLDNPDWCIRLELREQAYLYHSESKGAGGLPSGSSGRGMLLLSGGIDSPVAGHLMACRGMYLEAVYFDTPPFTTDAAYDKVRRLAARLARWTHSGPAPRGQQGLILHRVPFTEVQLALRKHSSPAALTLQSRACMVQMAEQLALRNGGRAQALISGEALGQVASQTICNLAYTNSFAQIPILRPLIGFDKEDIVAHSRRIGCFDISIEPHVDCCSYFAPEHPVTRANAPELQAELCRVPGLDELLKAALANIQSAAVSAHWDCA